MEISSLSGSNYNAQINKKTKNTKKIKLFLGVSAMSALCLAGRMSGKDVNIDSSKAFSALFDSLSLDKLSLSLNGIKSSFLSPFIENIAVFKSKLSSCIVNFSGIFDKNPELNFESTKGVHQG